MRPSSLRTLAAALLAGAGLSTAAAVNLSGTIYDKDNKPLPGVVVSLAKGGLADTTGADGKWLLAGSSTGISRAASLPTAHWNGKVLSLSLIAPATVQVESFDARGARLGLLAQARLEAGSHTVPVGSARAATGMRWLRLSVDGRTQVIATGSGAKIAQNALPGALARSAEDSVDQILYVLQGQLITADTVVNLIQSGLEKWIQEFSVSGKVTADARVSVDTVLAWFDGGRMTGMRRGRLGFNKANNAYSGRIYAVKSLTGDVYNYRVWLNVMGNGNRRTGISDTTDFSSDFGAIDFIPVFSVANALPEVFIVDTAGEISTDLTLHAQTKTPGGIASVEWSVNGSPFIAGGKDTTIKLPTVPTLDYHVLVRVTDKDGNVSMLDTARIVVGEMITDSRDGQRYRIVTIGTQTWMAQNLNYKVDSSWWYRDNKADSATYYNSPIDQGATYGRLYTWAAAMGLHDSCNTKSCSSLVSAKHQGACPNGWHVPSDNEWKKLTDTTLSPATTGAKLKAASSLWQLSEGTDDFGFSSLPGGIRYSNGIFSDIGYHCNFWGATQNANAEATYREIYEDNNVPAMRYSGSKLDAISLRCIKD